MKLSNIRSSYTGLVGIVLVSGAVLAQFAYAGSATTVNDRFTNIGSISNTRHNMTQSSAPLIAGSMDAVRNNYGEVCVYCHTPHGANNTIAAPLWNRTIKVTNYQTYDELGTSTLTQAVTSTPGSASLTCLSCHDGQTAIDSIINMPGSGMGLLSQQTTQNTAFLDSWPPSGGGAVTHMGLNSTNGVLGSGDGAGSVVIGTGPGPGCVNFGGTYYCAVSGQGCLSCHSDVGSGPAAGFVVDFRMFNLGTDLRNDHPIGITFPIANTVDFKTPAGVKGSSQYFDSTTQGTPGKMDKAEIRTYEGRVECASCHDPHGVPGPGGVFKKTFLRVDNSNGSAVCLTCHTK